MASMPKIITAVFGRTWVRALLLCVAVALSLWSFERVPNAAWLPALLGLLPWAFGKYVLCPLRWHALSVSGKPRRWHLRVYAEARAARSDLPGPRRCRHLAGPQARDRPG